MIGQTRIESSAKEAEKHPGQLKEGGHPSPVPVCEKTSAHTLRLRRPGLERRGVAVEQGRLDLHHRARHEAGHCSPLAPDVFLPHSSKSLLCCYQTGDGDGLRFFAAPKTRYTAGQERNVSAR